MKHYFITLFITTFIVFAISCQKDPDPPNNPFDDITLNPPPDTTQQIDTSLLIKGSFAWLHAHVFAPTCANSGCHDGTFEPEFRTLQGTYNTLVNKYALKIDTVSGINTRVVPNKPDSSMLYLRLTQFLPNSSGIMPLQTEPNSDWETQKSEYLQLIRTWIQNGAPNN